jgi:CDP-glycerol glycerophosphotransferase
MYSCFVPLYYFSQFIPKQKNLWLFGAWHGERYSDNSKYLFEYVVENHKEIEPVWVTTKKEIFNKLKGRGCKVVLKNTIEWFLLSLKAKVAIFTHSERTDIAPFLNPNSTILVDVQHGVPFKKIVFDENITLKDKIRNIIRSIHPIFKRNHHIVITTSQTSRRILSKALKLPLSRIKITGLPRNDAFFMKKKKENRDVINIAYLPTHRNDSQLPYKILHEFLSQRKEWESFLDKINANFYIKPHGKINFECSSSKRIIFLDWKCDIYEILKNCDILITDYSSVFIDFLLSEKPIIFTPFDFEDYTKKREFYFDYYSYTPGPKAKNWSEVKYWIAKFIENPSQYSEERKKMLHFFHMYKDGRSCERVFKEIMKEIKFLKTMHKNHSTGAEYD